MDQGERLPLGGLEVAGMVDCDEYNVILYGNICYLSTATGIIVFVDTTIHVGSTSTTSGHCKYSLQDSFDSVDTWAWYSIEFVKLAFCFKALLQAYRYALPLLV